MRMPFCSHLLLLRLPNLGLPYLLHSAFLKPFIPDAMQCMLPLYEDNADMLLNMYMLLCANKVLFTISACA